MIRSVTDLRLRIVLQIASHLDLNSLHDLSATCRQFHANLIQYRKQLVRQTLRCVNDERPRAPCKGTRSGQIQTRRGHFGPCRDNLTSGRVGLCARDLVGDCRRCGMIVCRV